MLGFNPLASAPLSDDGIVVVSSSITLFSVSSQVIHNNLQVNPSKTITTVSSVTDVNNLQVNPSKTISNISSQVTQGSLSTTVDITLSSTSTTGQLGTINRVVGVSTTLDSVSTASQVGTTAGSTSSNKTVTSVSATGSVNDSSVSTSSNKSVTSVSATGQVRTPQIGPSEHLVAVSVTGNVTSPFPVVSSSVEINQVTSTSQVGSINTTTRETGELTSVSSIVSISSVETLAESLKEISSLSSSLSASDLFLVVSSNKSLVNVSSSATVNSLIILVSDEVSLSGVSSSVNVNDFPFVGTPVNATVDLSNAVRPNLYYSGVPSSVYAYDGALDFNGIKYTSSTQYQSSGVGAEFYFKVASNYSGGTQYFFQADGDKTGWSYQRAYGILQSTSGIGGYVRLGNQLGRNAAASVSVYLPNSGTFSSNSWYKGRIYSAGQRVYAQIFDGSGSLLASNSQLMTISYGSYTTNSYQFFLDEFVVGDDTGNFGNAFTGQITDFSITGASLNPVRSRVLYQRTTPTWAATNSFTNNATAADTLVFDSPFKSSHLVTSQAVALNLTAAFSSDVTAFATGVSSSVQVQPLNQNISVSLTGVTSSQQLSNLVVNPSLSLTTISSTPQVSNLTVNIAEIIPSSVSSQVLAGQVTVSNVASVTGVSSSSQVNALEKTVSSNTLVDSLSSSVIINPVVPINNSLVTVDSVTSTSTSNQVSVNINEEVNLTGVEAGTAVQFGGVESNEAILRKVTTTSQVGTLTINVSTTIPSASSAFNTSDQVKGVINVSVQLSTLPLVTVGRGSITLSTDGFNFEEFKNLYDKARTVYISRAA